MNNLNSTSNDAVRWSHYPYLLWRGVCMGIAEVIPGVSGGTIALITGILGRLVEAIHSFDLTAIRMLVSLKLPSFFSRVQWKFMLMLFSGQFLGIVLCTKIIPLPKLLRTHPEPMYGLFFGLILGSIILLARDGGRPGWRGIVSYVIGIGIGTAVVAGVRADTPETMWFVFLCGAIAICAWILPGISGSFVLLILHKYDYIWEAVTLSNGLSVTHNLLLIATPFALGAVFGLISFSRLLSWVMNNWPKITTMCMNGLLIASLWAIFPFQNQVFESVASGKEKLISTHPYIPSADKLLTLSGSLAIILASGGLFLVLWIDYMARRSRGSSTVTPKIPAFDIQEPQKEPLA